MPYTVGISSGMFGVAQQNEKLEYLTILRKVAYGATKGVNFTQLDLESINEFIEPWITESVASIKSLGLTFGIHGESAAMTGIHTLPLDSAIENDYIRSHRRLMEHLEGGAKIGAKYVLLHASESTPIIMLEREWQPARLVDIWGRSLDIFLKERPKIVDWLLKDCTRMKQFVSQHLHDSEYWEREFIRDFHEKQGKAPGEEDIKKIKQDAWKTYTKSFFNFVVSNQTGYGYELIAYYAIAKWMEMENDSLWLNIVGKKKFDEVITRDEMWVPAVTTKYIWGHFNPIADSKLEDPKPILARSKMYFLLETEMAKGGYEGYMRLAKPVHMYHLAVASGTPWFGLAIDFEHLLSCNLDPKKEIEALPQGAGKFVRVCHLGWPTPHIPAHIPIPLGSDAQLWIYDVLCDLRKKGFMDGILVFERAGLPIEESILSIRKIAEYLDKDIPPSKLPEDFFGLKPLGAEIKMQQVRIREHALDPLKGMLSIQEEEYTFLSEAALKKGKAELWKKEQYK